MNAPGVAVDLSHISTPAKTAGGLPPNDGLKTVLTGADIIVIPAGVPRKPGVSALVNIALNCADISLSDDKASGPVARV